MVVWQCSDFLGRNRAGGPSVIGQHFPQSVSVFVRELFRRSADQLVVAQPGANARRWERIFWGFDNTGNDVLQEHVRYGDLRLWFAKTLTDLEINDIAAALLPLLCYNSYLCFDSS